MNPGIPFKAREYSAYVDWSILQIAPEIPNAEEFLKNIVDDRKKWNMIPRWLEERKDPVSVVFDIGCGSGVLSVFCKKLLCAQEVCAMDRVALNTRVQKKFDINFQQGNIETDGILWPGAFDTIILAEVLQFFRGNPVYTLTRIGDMLTPKGVLYLTTPDSASDCGKNYTFVEQYHQLPNPLSPAAMQPVPQGTPITEPVWYYSQMEMVEIFTHSGFSIVRFGQTVSNLGSHLNYALVRA